ncbi:protein DOUBLE-STRAND BREAK FORMATION [Lactuca sativa]|uniref:protein DOUBLE-STRAND BREAK FORMATION n=1 Tax=Lactuca sativa TaxID=4236 RepID=UPI000CD8F048|nr:protein DOUBLE-STRAND BREAK FORMATION [Lactuca sativa]
MCDSEVVSQQISLFRSLIQTRRFDDGTLRILESVLISRDVKLMLDVRRSLRDFMRHESLCVLSEFKEKSVDHNLLIIEFFVHAFAFIGDLESCLSLRYEALILRELKSATDHQLHVSYGEWLTFAEHAFENRFYAISRKACEKALACFQTNDVLKPKETDALSDIEAIRKVKRLKDLAMIRVASQSVQAQGVKYLKRKTAECDNISMPVIKEKRHSASILFRNGIKKHNTRKLQQLRRL